MTRRTTRILVCGFEPFGGRAGNPSADIALALAEEAGVQGAILPVSYSRAGEMLVSLLQSPLRALLLLGMWPGGSIKLERRAINLDDSPQADAEGEIRQGEPIAPAGPESYLSTLPLETFEQALLAADLPVAWSDDAGGYVCNHVFYTAARQFADSGVSCGLVHVPATLDTAAQVGGFKACLACLRKAS